MNTTETPYQKWLRINSVKPLAPVPAERPWKVTVDRDGNRFVFEAENA